MTLRKFKIKSVKLSPGGAGPDRLYEIYYKAIKDKKWIDGKLLVIAVNEKDAKDKAYKRFGGIN